MVDKPHAKTFAARFEIMLDACNLTRAQFAKMDGIGQANITNWIKRGGVGRDSQPRVREITGASMEWLNDGIGNAPTGRAVAEPHAGYSAHASVSHHEIAKSYVRFEHPNAHGKGETTMMEQEYPEIIRAIEVRSDEAAMMVGTYQNGSIRVVGIGTDSMAPTLNPKDLVFIDVAVRAFTGDGIYFLNYDGSMLCKRLQKVQRGRIDVISDNRTYATWSIERDDPTPWAIIARVLSTLPIKVQHLA